MRHLFLPLLFCFFTNQMINAQSLCSDPQAKNYQKTGTCQYKKTRLKASNKVKLAARIDENSGLIYFNGGYLTHNDSGSENELYFLDENGVIRKTIKIINAKNVDWEDIAQDETHIYIGDFGNNAGNRKDLIIYKIRKQAIQAQAKDEVVNVSAEKIVFDYANRPSNLVKYQHDYDCEAFTYYNGALHLFTKNWGNQQTYHYTLPTEAGEYVATLQDSLNVKGLITAADISTEGEELLLLGYTKKGRVFVWWCHHFNEESFFSGENRRFELGNILFRGQAEGITFTTQNKVIYSAEKIKMWKPRIFELNVGKYRNEKK